MAPHFSPHPVLKPTPSLLRLPIECLTTQRNFENRRTPAPLSPLLSLSLNLVNPIVRLARLRARRDAKLSLSLSLSLSYSQAGDYHSKRIGEGGGELIAQPRLPVQSPFLITRVWANLHSPPCMVRGKVNGEEIT